MEIDEKLFFGLILVSCLLSGFIGYAFNSMPFHVHRDPQVSANVYVLIETIEGSSSYSSGNIITDIGEAYVRNILGWDNVTSNNATQWISLGNATIAQTLTKLGVEATTVGFERAANDTCVAWNNGTDRAYNVTNKFTATGNIAVNATGCHWNPTGNSDNNMFACAYLTDGTMHQFTATSNCTVTWVFTVDAN